MSKWFHIGASLHFWMALFFAAFLATDVDRIMSYKVKFVKLTEIEIPRYLTIWNLILQAAFFTICLINDVIGTNADEPKNKPVIRVVKDTMLAAVAFPLSMLVGLTFWILYAIDRELIFPKALDEFFPSWLNHAMHTNVMLFTLIEMYISFRRYPNRKIGFGILTSILFVYMIWIHIINAYSGVWVYPFLTLLSLPVRLVFFIVMMFISYGVYVSGEELNRLIWAKKLQTIQKAA